MRAGAHERARAVRVIEDVIRTFPEGATDEVLVGRLERVGVDRDTTRSLLAELARSRRLRREGERWRLVAS